jgi:putative transposase
MGSFYERRNSLRMKGYDYSREGAYYITIVVKDRQCLLGAVECGRMAPSALGRIVLKTWDELPNHYKNVQLGAFCIMPDHVHGIIFITSRPDTGDGHVGAGFKPAPTMCIPAPTRNHGLSEIIRGFKTFSARRINEYCQTAGQAFWQRNFYDRIIREEEELMKLEEYIRQNPSHWDKDQQVIQSAVG